MNKLIERINSPTPPFWKKVRKAGLIIGAIGTGLLSITALPFAAVASILITIGSTTVAVASVASTIHD
jgi:hypothetical protein